MSWWRGTLLPDANSTIGGNAAMGVMAVCYGCGGVVIWSGREERWHHGLVVAGSMAAASRAGLGVLAGDGACGGDRTALLELRR